MSNILEATSANFESEVLNSDTPVLVDFWATWCGPCKALTPIITELAEDNPDNLKVFKLDVDESQDIAAKYGIRGVPTVILFNKGEVAEQVVGVRSKEDYQKMVDGLS